MYFSSFVTTKWTLSASNFSIFASIPSQIAEIIAFLSGFSFFSRGLSTFSLYFAL